MNQLPVFSSRTNQKLHIISVTHKMIKKFRTNLDLAKASGPDYNPVVFLRNFEFQLWDILAELFNICLKHSCFPNCWKVLTVVPVFPDVGERSTPINYRPVSLLSVVSKAFEKLVNDSLVDDLEKIGLFLISNMVILLDQLQIFWRLYHRITSGLTRATRAVAFDISKTFNRVWYAGLLHKFESYGI